MDSGIARRIYVPGVFRNGCVTGAISPSRRGCAGIHAAASGHAATSARPQLRDAAGPAGDVHVGGGAADAPRAAAREGHLALRVLHEGGAQVGRVAPPPFFKGERALDCRDGCGRWRALAVRRVRTRRFVLVRAPPLFAARSRRSRPSSWTACGGSCSASECSGCCWCAPTSTRTRSRRTGARRGDEPTPHRAAPRLAAAAVRRV